MVGCTSEVTLRLARHIIEREEANKHTAGIDNGQAAQAVITHQLRRARHVVLAPTTNKATAISLSEFFFRNLD
jgi:hypothetical protein